MAAKVSNAGATLIERFPVKGGVAGVAVGAVLDGVRGGSFGLLSGLACDLVAIVAQHQVLGKATPNAWISQRDIQFIKRAGVVRNILKWGTAAVSGLSLLSYRSACSGADRAASEGDCAVIMSMSVQLIITTLLLFALGKSNPKSFVGMLEFRGAQDSKKP